MSKVILEGVLQRADAINHGRIYPIEDYVRKSRAVVRIGNSLYTKMEESEDDVISGFEYFLSDEDPYMRVQALKGIIYTIEKRIKNKHL